MMDSVMAVIDRHKLSVASAVCVLPLVLAASFLLIFEAQSRRAHELAAEQNVSISQPHNIFDDMSAQRQALEPAEEDCRALHGTYDGAGCVIPHLAR